MRKFYSAIKKKEIMKSARKFMDLKIIKQGGVISKKALTFSFSCADPSL